MTRLNIHFVADKTLRAQQALREAESLYSNISSEDADFWVVFGGDGFLLRNLHKALHEKPVKIFGINCGTLGFLMNEFNLKNLSERLMRAEGVILNPLMMETIDIYGTPYTHYAINEVSLLRYSSQAAHLKISVDGIVQLNRLVCDGILVATPAGSTAYNYSAHGPIIPLTGNVLALTPLSPFRPRRWRGALLAQSKSVEIHVLDFKKRPVSAVADFYEVKDVQKVSIHQLQTKHLELLFDKESNLEKRIIREQFRE